MNYEIKAIMPDNPQDIAAAVDLINHFYQLGAMLPASIDHYMKLAALGHVLGAYVEDQLIGTAAISQQYPNNVCELGGAAVYEEYQGNGLATALLEKRLAIAHDEGKSVIVFANPQSEGYVAKAGGVAITDFSKVPKEALALCATCPRKPQKGCCDTIYEFPK